MSSSLTQEQLDDMLAQELDDCEEYVVKLPVMGDGQACRRLPLAFAALSHLSLAGRPAHPASACRTTPDSLFSTHLRVASLASHS